MKLADEITNEDIGHSNLYQESPLIELQVANALDVSVQSVSAMEKSRTTEDGMADYTETLDESNESVDDAKNALSSAAFDPHKPSPDVCNIIGLVSTNSMSKNPMLSKFEVNKLYFSSKVAGKLLVFKQENEGSMVVNNLPTREKFTSWKLMVDADTVDADDDIDVYYRQVSQDVVYSKSFSSSVKVDEGYSWIKGYINEDFMFKTNLKKIPDISTVRSDFYNYDIANLNSENFGQILVKVWIYGRLYLFLKPITANIEVKIQEFHDGEDLGTLFKKPREMFPR